MIYYSQTVRETPQNTKGANTMNTIKTLRSKVMTIANRFVKHGLPRRMAMIKAWGIAKNPNIHTKVKGVTVGRRQEAIAHLRRYAAADISVTLERESGNAADSNAVAVIATVKGKGSYQIGYLPRYLAAVVAPLMDAHKAVAATFQEVRGGERAKPNFGLAIGITI